MQHLRVAAITFIAAGAVFWLVGLGTYAGLKAVVAHSPFRLAVATNAARFAGQTINLVVGDSRLMDGVNAEQINTARGRVVVFNAAFNGIEYPEALTVVEAFIQTCQCHLGKVLIDETALWEETPGVSETEAFLAAFDAAAEERLSLRDPRRARILEIFPAIHFNNEVTLRSLYYLAAGTSDQDHGNTYRFRVPKNKTATIGTTAKVNHLKADDVAAMVRKVEAAGGSLLVVVPPHHPAYTEGRVGFTDYIASVRKEVLEAGAEFQDDSRHFVDRPDVFSDLIHLHVDGQYLYSRYLMERVFQ